ncbi:MAG: ribosomal protein S18-alanine N-acetyltransferase [Deltaproteobacteria bacterium]|nr:ribosomal protein S18-alanine N-acetyltransferase [Deltaproteobacteria bacterium]
MARYDALDVGEMVLDDLDEVLAVDARALKSSWSRAHFLVELESPLGAAYVARSPRHRDGALLGFAVVRVVADECEVLTVAVDPKARRRGVGRALLERALGDAQRRGATRAHLEVRAGNRAAIALYALLGFGERGLRARYYVNPTEDALLMTADLARPEVEAT